MFLYYMDSTCDNILIFCGGKYCCSLIENKICLIYNDYSKHVIDIMNF